MITLTIKIPTALKSRKFWLAVAAAFIAFGNTMWDWGFSQEQVSAVISPLLIFIGVEGAADALSRLSSKE